MLHLCIASIYVSITLYYISRDQETSTLLTREVVSLSLSRALSLSLYNVYVDITRRLLSRFFSRRVFKRRIAS